MTGSTKNPNNEAENPAPMPPDHAKPRLPSGENSQGNDRGEQDQDLEGKQGGQVQISLEERKRQSAYLTTEDIGTMA